MFETVEQTIWQFLNFMVLGFFLGLGYEVFRIGRMFFKKHQVLDAIEDVIYLSVCAVVCFSFSMEIGSGVFRFFYVAGALVGCFLYFMTLGQLISLVSKFIVKWIKRVWRFLWKYLINPTRIIIVKMIQNNKSKLVKNAVFLREKSKNAGRYLKKQSQLMYNKKNRKNKDLKGENSGKSTVIQARIKVKR